MSDGADIPLDYAPSADACMEGRLCDPNLFVVAMKDGFTPGEVRRGEVLTSVAFRKREFAERHRPCVAGRKGIDPDRVGVFQGDRFVS